MLTSYLDWNPNEKSQVYFGYNQEYFSDQNHQSTFTGAYYRNKKIKNFVVLSPFVESSYSFSNVHFPGGLPYFALNSRLYGGGGFRLSADFDKDETLKIFNSFIEPSFFADSFYKTYFRLRSETDYRLRKYTYLFLDLEYFSQQNFFSNTVNIGFKHVF